MSISTNLKVNSPGFTGIKQITGAEEKVKQFIEANAKGYYVHGRSGEVGIILDGEHVADFFQKKHGIKIPEWLVNVKDDKEAADLTAKYPVEVQQLAKKLTNAARNYFDFLTSIFHYASSKEAEGAEITHIKL